MELVSRAVMTLLGTKMTTVLLGSLLPIFCPMYCSCSDPQDVCLKCNGAMRLTVSVLLAMSFASPIDDGVLFTISDENRYLGRKPSFRGIIMGSQIEVG